MSRDVVFEFVKKRFRIDTRSLAVFRIVAGILIVADVLLRARSFRFFYTDEGVLPVEVARNIIPSDAVSIFLLSGDPTVTAVLFVLHLLIGIQLIVGYHTRFAIVASFLLVVSLDWRNTLVTSYADVLFRHLLFWGMFLPLGERFSIDAIRRERAPRATFTGLAGMFILLQMMFMYLANGSHKIPWREDWLSGESMIGILHYDTITFLLGDYLREITPLLQFGGIMWYGLMLGSPALILVAGRIRYQLAGIYAGGHLFLAITVRIGAFPYAALMGLALFCQSVFWADARRAASILGLPVDRYYAAGVRYGAAIERRLPRVEIRDRLRERIPPTETVIARAETPARFAVAFLVITSGVFMVVPNLQTVGAIDEDREIALQEEVEDIQQNFRLVQPPWRFYQGPITYDEYYVFPAETEDGEVFDAFNDRPMSWERAHGEKNHKQLETYRHRFFMYSIMTRGDENREDGVIESYQRYLCENVEWNGSSLAYVNMYYIRERGDIETIDDYTTYDRTATLMAAHSCSGGEPKDIVVPPIEYTHYSEDVYDRILDPEDELTYVGLQEEDD